MSKGNYTWWKNFSLLWAEQISLCFVLGFCCCCCLVGFILFCCELYCLIILTGYLPNFCPTPFSHSLASLDGTGWSLFNTRDRNKGWKFYSSCNVIRWCHIPNPKRNDVIASSALEQALPNWICDIRNCTHLSIEHKCSLWVESYSTLDIK